MTAIELIFAFDEVLTAGGSKEDATLTTILSDLLMDSHKEKMALMIEEDKKREAKKMMDQYIKDIQKIKIDNLKNKFMSNGALCTNPRMSWKIDGFGGGGHLWQSSGIFDGFNPDKKNNYSSGNTYETTKLRPNQSHHGRWPKLWL